MTFTKPTYDVDNIQNLADQPIESATVLKQTFDKTGADAKTYESSLVDELEATTDGNSGMDNVGMTPINGMTATTPQGVMEELNDDIQTQLPVPDGSLEDVKLSNDAGQIKDQVNILNLQYEETVSGIFNVVKKYGADPTGVVDSTSAIQSAINDAGLSGGGVVLLDGKLFKISSPILINYDNVTISGLTQDTTLSTSTDTINGIEVGSNIRKCTFKSFTILSALGIGASNAGIKWNDTNGGAEHLIIDVKITSFYYGETCKEIFWNSTHENVRWESCGYSFYCDSTGGQCINNLFIRCISNQPTIMGMYLLGLKCWTFIDCNFGGHAINTTQYIYLDSVSVGVSFMGCNFEGATIAATNGGIAIWSSSMVEITNCTFVLNEGVSSTAYEIFIRDSASVVLSNNKQILAGSNIKQVGLINTSRVVNLDNSLSDISHPSGSNSLTKVFSPSSSSIAVASEQLDLSGIAQETIVLPSSVTGRITKIKLIYTEASSADAGVTVTLKSADNIYTYFSGTSEISKAKWYEFSPTLATTYISASPIIATTVGGKTGIGKISVVVEYCKDN